MKNVDKNLMDAMVNFEMACGLLAKLGTSDAEMMIAFTSNGVSAEDIALLLTNVYTDEIDDNEVKAILLEKLLGSAKQTIKMLKMAQGYEEMADINIGISAEDFHLEDEGAKRIDELGNEKTDKEA